MSKYFLLLLVALFPAVASAQVTYLSCSSLPKESTAYQTCMLRAENAQRDRIAEERYVAEQKQRKENNTETAFQLLNQRAELVRELNRMCDAAPTEDCDILATKSGLYGRIQALKSAYDRAESRSSK